MRTTPAVAAALLAAAALLTTSCTSSSDQAEATPTPSHSKTANLSSFAACSNLLEDNYRNDNVHDASHEPECSGLSKDEYDKAVVGVLAGHKDDFLADAEQQLVWDEAWKQTDPDQQQVTCDRLLTDGPTVVGNEMADAAGADSDGTEVDMAKYILAEKC